MSNAQLKPLHWRPKPGIGYTVVRRQDGGMHVTFTSMDEPTLKDWREFALSHLYDSDNLTRNLYDLRAIEDIPESAVNLAVEANNDPSARNIRLAVVLANEDVREGLLEIMALSSSPGGGANIKLFTELDVAEAWLNRPLDSMV